MNPKIILLMGVSSSGKTTIGERLSADLGWPFLDGDLFHPTENVEKMRQGLALNDQDRMPWLKAMRARIDQESASGRGAIFACSALKASYREILMTGVPDMVLVHLIGSREKLRERANARVHQYMPASLLDSQFETLEMPEDAVMVSVEGSVDQAVTDLKNQIWAR